MGFLSALRRWAIKGKGNYRKRALTPLKTQKTTKFKKKPLYATKRSGFVLASGGKPYALREYISTDLFVVALIAWFVNLDMYFAIRVLSSSVVLTRLM